jgi:class 3 adenylate cyclase
MAGAVKPPPLPNHPVLAAWASALNDTGYWAEIYDAEWRYVFVTDELLASYRALGSEMEVPVGAHIFSAAGVRFVTAQIGGSWPTPETRRAWFLAAGRYALASTPGGREALRQLVDPELADLVDELQPLEHPVVFSAPSQESGAGVEPTSFAITAIAFRLYDSDDQVVGFCTMPKPAAGMSHLAVATATADLMHLERMRVVERADRHPAAILMADLEASSALSRRLSTAQFFAFTRRLVRAADRFIIDNGGIVGRHIGDGVTAYFVAEALGSESAAARACIRTAQELRVSVADIARRSEIADSELSLRFGLHWGATLYMGRILTTGRSEVTALGDEVNEAARIEACATSGRTLASKVLLERLTSGDADALGVDISHMTYIPLTDLPSATDKARRDAPSIAVCELTGKM